MFLANLAGNSEDLLICDFAQFYHVFDYKELRPSVAATLAMGLPEESRIKKKITGVDATLDQLLMAMILDDLNLLLWTKQKHKGPKPKRVYQILTSPKEKKEELMAFRSPEDYMKWRARKEEHWECQKLQPPTSK